MDVLARWSRIFCRGGVVAIVLLSASTLCVAAKSPGAEIRFGVEALVPPFESRNAQGELVGLNIELGNALCDSLYSLSSRLVARKGSGLLPDAASLKGKTIGVLRGTNREAYAKNLWGAQGIAIRSYALNDELVRNLQAGEIDATLQDTLEIAEAFLKTPQGKGFEFTGPVVIDERLGSAIAIGVRQQDRELREALNRALQSLKDSGRYTAIVSRYLPVGLAATRHRLGHKTWFNRHPVGAAVGVTPDSASVPGQSASVESHWTLHRSG